MGEREEANRATVRIVFNNRVCPEEHQGNLWVSSDERFYYVKDTDRDQYFAYALDDISTIFEED